MRVPRLVATCAAVMLLCGCTSPERGEGTVTEQATPTPSQSALSAAPSAAPTPKYSEAAAVENCGDALYYWYPFEGDGTGGWNARFTPGESEATAMGSEWRVVFNYVGGDEESEEVTIDDAPHDGRAATWCETNPDGSYDVGIVGGPELLDKNLDDLKEVMFARSGELRDAGQQ